MFELILKDNKICYLHIFLFIFYIAKSIPSLCSLMLKDTQHFTYRTMLINTI